MNQQAQVRRQKAVAAGKKNQFGKSGRRGWGLILALLGMVAPADNGFARRHAVHDARLEPRITLRLVDFAQVPDRTIRGAEKEVGLIFRQAGVGVVWVDCRLDSERDSDKSLAPSTPQSDGRLSCRQRLGPAEFWLNLVSRRPPGFDGEMLGFAPATASESGDSANILYPMVESVAANAEMDTFQILAVAAAHEVGHLLLGPNSHSPSGIMYAHWRREEFELVSIRELLFTPEQAQRLQQEVRKRSAPTMQVGLLLGAN